MRAPAGRATFTVLLPVNGRTVMLVKRVVRRSAPSSGSTRMPASPWYGRASSSIGGLDSYSTSAMASRRGLMVALGGGAASTSFTTSLGGSR